MTHDWLRALASRHAGRRSARGGRSAQGADVDETSRNRHDTHCELTSATAISYRGEPAFGDKHMGLTLQTRMRSMRALLELIKSGRVGPPRTTPNPARLASRHITGQANSRLPCLQRERNSRSASTRRNDER